MRLDRARIGGGLVGLAAVLLLLWAVREPLTALATAMVSRLGLPGIFLSAVVLDPVPGVGFQAPLLFGAAGGVPFWTLFAVVSAASLLSSVLCWALGRRLQRWDRLPPLLERTGVTRLLNRHGTAAIALASILPVPYGLATIGAGATGVAFTVLLRGAIFRPLKILAALAFFAAGLS